MVLGDINEETRFLVVSHLSGTRTFEEMVAIFQKGLDNSKVRPRAVFVDGSQSTNQHSTASSIRDTKCIESSWCREPGLGQDRQTIS